MIPLTADTLADYLHSAGRVPSDEALSIEWLSGGVSNVVFRVERRRGRAFVVKQSREQLRTQADWFSRLDRVWREADAMELLSPLLPREAVPRVWFQDRDNYLFAMKAVDRPHAVWKTELLGGVADPAVARAAANILAEMHGATCGRVHFYDRLGDREVFEQLRLDPFYRYVADRHANVRRALLRLIDQTLLRSECVVHADFSPKNLLIVRGSDPEQPQVTLVDFETAHYGDPAFDLGFFLAHLLLKTTFHATRRPEFLGLVRTFMVQYDCRLKESLDRHSVKDWAPSESQVVAHLGGCLLARIDGKSPVDYLQEPAQRDAIRRFARTLLLEPPPTLSLALKLFEEGVGS